MALEFTPGQAQAIETRGTSLLVSAAAGSGKTRVLVERLMRYVTDPENPRDIDSFLIITYTRAAAAQLKARVSGALAALAAERPDDARLRRQLNLSYRAQIGTIHSFCAALLRENCQYLELPPGFSVLEGDRERVLRQTVLERVLDARYEKMQKHPGFERLVDTVGAGRDDSRLAALVPELWEKLRSHPYPEDWAAEQMSALGLEGVSDAGQTPWGRELLDGALVSARGWRARLDAAAGDIRDAGGKIAKAYLASFEDTVSSLDGFIAALGQGWDAARGRLPIAFPRLGGLRNYEDADFADEMKNVRASCKKAAGGWAASLAGSSDELIADMRAMALVSRALLELTLDFDRAYAAEKKRRGCVDFSDLEHMAARLLVDKASGRPTWIAREAMQRYTEIMVDEYQDVNAVQELIFTALARPEGNLFLVGDVKQSIYRFRLADPSIFLRKSGSWPDVGGDVEPRPEGRRVLLRENFRSHREVLRAVNHVFSNIMSRELGELDYDDSAALRFGAAGYPDSGGGRVELDIIDPDGDAPEDAPEKCAAEAEFVARRINELVSSGASVYDGGVPRRCEYGDFAILLRSPSANGAVFRQRLASAGIPVQARQGGGFFTRFEVATALNMLCAVDNPHADVPLISVLRSPAFAFTPDELAAVRAGARGGDFYSALRACAEKPAAGPAAKKSADFLSLLDALRDAAPELGVSALLRRIYDEADLPALCSAMDSPGERRGNLERLFELAQDFENGGESGVLRFTQKLRRMAERGEEPPAGGEDECVKIMSIHKSKGLEFPFVFLCDLSHGFNRSDLNSPVLLHTELGLGPKLTDAARGIEYPTLARRAIAQKLTDELLSEEMRVLYVGMTRARERLFMTCTMARALAAPLALDAGGAGPAAPELLRTSPCFARWLIAAARVGDGGGISLNLISPSDAPETGQDAVSDAPAPGLDGALYEALRARLDWRYGFERAVSLPSKLTATGLKGRADDAERMDEAACVFPDGAEGGAGVPDAAPVFRRPEFGRAATPASGAAERGTATHALLQRMDLALAGDEKTANAELERLRRGGILTDEQARAADVRAVVRFGKSALCRRMLAAQELRREFRFTLLAEAADYFDAPSGERLLMQGVADCFFVEDGGITLVDYKTDRVSAAGAFARAMDYAAQLETYARALERIRGLPVRGKLVYFLTPGVCVEL